MYLKYLWSLLRHKWFVFLECCKLGILWLGLTHDISKFLPSEFVYFARKFKGNYPTEYDKATGGYVGNKASAESITYKWGYAWNHHSKNNKHHPEYWVMAWSGDPSFYDDCGLGEYVSDNIRVLLVPKKYCLEMLADWRGAGRAYGSTDIKGFYENRKENILLHSITRAWIEQQLIQQTEN